jgi:hypothetical protein
VPTKIILKNSVVQDKVPLPADIDVGELAVNLNENSPAIYSKDSAGNVVKLAGEGSVSTPPASETVAGIAELATQVEVDAGTDDLRIVTPLKLTTYVSQNLWIDGGSAVSNFGSAPAEIDGGAAA